ncbi:MAG: hypothetical protein IPP97_17475 [Candidatus Obscuribacter sp.]|nr:hypothetical protein [Candidatus Obscuribacter sp.]
MTAKRQNDSDHEHVKTITRSIVFGMEPPVTLSSVTNALETAITVAKGLGRNGPYDMDRLVRELRSTCTVTFAEEAGVLKNLDHKSWVYSPRAVNLPWDFWERYKDWLLRIEEFPTEPLRKLEEHSHLILDLLEDPERAGPWSRRGLVVGQVQSGKTMNFTALINKAADAGYKLIIVLAGLWENLRYQTQGRLSEGFLGKESQRFELNDDSRVGVGLIKTDPRAWCGTSLSADFSKPKKSFGAVLGKENPLPFLLVVKKNKSILNNVRDWVLDSSNVVVREDGTKVIKDVPLLIIDDEADHASINTNDVPLNDDDTVDEEHSPTAINGGIRKILSLFERNAYVGYTATPFANVFIRPDSKATDAGEDLFPRSFIVNLPTPSNYVGAAQLFGYDEDDPYNLTEHIRPRVLIPVNDYQNWVPDKHKNGFEPGGILPDTLKRAMRSFVLVCAARIVRGQQDKHNTMLIHVTRFSSVQDEVAKQVKTELSTIQRRLKYDDAGSDAIHKELRKIWEEDFVPVSRSFGEPDISYDDLIPHLKTASGQISPPKIINGKAKDVLDYEKGTAHLIAIGGKQTLARIDS